MTIREIDINESIKAEKLISNELIIDKIIVILFPIILTFVFPITSGIQLYSNLKNNESLLLGILLFVLSIFISFSIIFWIRNLNKLKRIKGFSKTENLKLIKKISKDNEWKINSISENLIILDLNTKKSGIEWEKRMIIINKGNDILVNCMTYGKYSSPSIFHWFANKRKINKLKFEFEYGIEEKQNINKLIQPKFNLKIDGMKFLGRGSKASGNGIGWNRNENIIYKCVECGSEMLASHNDYWNCECGAIHLDFDAGRFGSNYGDENILVYKKIN